MESSGLFKLASIVILIFYMVDVLVLKNSPRWFMTVGLVIGMIMVYFTQKEGFFKNENTNKK